MINLIKKEIRELLTKSALLFFAFMALIFVFMGQMLSEAQEEAAVSPVVAVVDQDKSHHSATLVEAIETGADVVYSGDDVSRAQSELESENGIALVLVPGGFGATIDSGKKAEIEVRWIMKGAGVIDTLPVSAVEAIIDSGFKSVSATLVEGHSSLDPEIILAPASSSYTTIYEGKTIEGVSPQVLSGLLSQETMFVPVVIMMLIVMGSSSVISSMGLEKENRTLETLLTMPVNRSHIIISKIIGSATAGVVMGAIYMVGFYFYSTSLGGQTGSLADLGFVLGPGDYFLISLSLFTALLAALCASIIMGTFASNYRSAQTLTYPLIGLAVLAMLVTMLLDFRTLPAMVQVIIFAIPFSHPMIAMKELMVDNYFLVLVGILYSSLLTAILVAVATRIFTTDRVVVGISIRRSKSRADSYNSQ